MKEVRWVKERNQELLEQITALREHAWQDNTPWSVSLRLLEDEIRKSLETLVVLLEAREEEIVSLRSTWQKEVEGLRTAHEMERSQAQKRIKQLENSISEAIAVQEEELARWKDRLYIKEAELEELQRLLELEPAKRRRRFLRRILFWTGLSILVISGYGFFVYQRDFWKTQRHLLPYAKPSVHAIIGKEVWIGDWLTQSLYIHRNERGLPLSRVIYAGGFHLSGLTGDGRRILGCDNWQKRFFSLSLVREEIEIADSRATPGGSPAGIFLDGEYLWSCDSHLQKIYRHRLAQPRSILGEYATPQISPIGLFRQGEILWALDGKTGKIFRGRIASDLEKIEDWQEMTEGFPLDGPKPVSLSADEKSLWVLAVRPAQMVRYNLRYLSPPGH